MEIENVPKRTFMSKYERHEPLIKDHTSVIAAKTCLRKYFYQIVIAKRPKEDAIYFAWGSAYHKFREILELTKDLPKAMTAGAGVWQAKQGANPPVGHKFEFLTAERLIKSFTVAYEHWQEEKRQNRVEVLAVEQPFNVELADGSFTSGRVDQIVRWGGKIWGRDFKTSSKEGMFYSRSLEPNDQFTRYTFAESKLAGEPVQGQIIEVLYNSKKEGPRISTYTAARSRYQLEQWEKENIHFNKIISLSRNEDVWPMQEVGCPFCPYHSVCKLPSEAAQMAQLDAEYVTRPWDNTTID